MTELLFSSRIRKAGLGLALPIPPEVARRVGIVAGDLVDATIWCGVEDGFGVLSDVYERSFTRKKERLWRQ